MEALARLWASVPPPPGAAFFATGVFVTVALPTPPATPTQGPPLGPPSPDYEGAYGKSLETLERE